MIPSPKDWYNSLGWSICSEEGEQILHPICSFEGVESFEPSSSEEKAAWEYAKTAKETAIKIVGHCQDALNAAEQDEPEAMEDALREAEILERDYATTALTDDVRMMLEFWN